MDLSMGLKGSPSGFFSGPHVAAYHALTQILPRVIQHQSPKIALGLKDYANDTPLDVAAKMGHVDFIRSLMGSPGSHKDSNLQRSAAAQLAAGAPLVRAAEANRRLLVNLLLDEYNVDINGTNESSSTPLLVAVDKNHDSMVHHLLENRADVNLVNIDGLSPLMVAKTDQMAVTLLDHHADPLACSKHSVTPLRSIVERGFLQALERIMSLNIDLDQPIHTEQTPFMLAISTGNWKVVYWLLDAGVMSSVQTQSIDEDKALTCAVRCGFDAILIELIEAGADVNLGHHTTGITALMLSASIGNWTTVEIILKADADIHLRNKQGCTAVMFAATNPTGAKAMKMLISAGANFRDKDRRHMTAFHCAAEAGRIEQAKLLLDLRVNINSTRKDGWTGLMLAVYRREVDMVVFLIDAGADVNVRC